jgi:hypothetical protein
MVQEEDIPGITSSNPRINIIIKLIRMYHSIFFLAQSSAVYFSFLFHKNWFVAFNSAGEKMPS